MASLRNVLRVAAVGLLLAGASRAHAVDCPNIVVYEPTGLGSVDAGWTGTDHDLPLLGPTLHLTVSCSSPTPPCGTCAITGIVPHQPGAPQRCKDDTSKPCSLASEVVDCGSVGSCRTHLGPPQSVSFGGYPFCITTDVAGPVGGTVDIESGAFAPIVPVHSAVVGGSALPAGGNAARGCPRCIGDPTANDGLRNGTCDHGPRENLACDANVASGPADFGSTSFDCPPYPADSASQFTGIFPSSTGTLTRTLGPASPNCPDLLPATPCFCALCNNANNEPCSSNADCPLSGGNPGICGGRRCVGGSNNGAPCTNTSACPAGGLCGRLGEPAKPDACLDDTNGNTDVCTLLPNEEGECALGPVVTTCSNHPNRACIHDGQCDDVVGACTARNRACFPGNGAPGASLSVSGTASAPVGGIADPTDLAVLSCLGPSSSSQLNYIGGFPGLVRATYPGRLLIVDPAVPTPIATVTPTPTPIPSPCSAAPAVCRAPFVGGKSSVQLTDRLVNDKDRLHWTWSKGSATTLGDLGDPVTSDEYALCLYDQTSLRATMQVPPGGTCQGKPCWRATATGFQYRNRDAAPHGITQLTLRAGADGKASLQAKGSGVPLPMPMLDTLTGTVRLQLRNRTSGLCWDTTFSPPFTKHTDEQLKDKAD